MKKILFIALLALLTVNINCGGGGVSSTDTSATTMVTINLGEVRDGSSLSASGTGVVSTSSIPPYVDSIRITISAPDMPTIQEIIPTAGLTSVSVTIEVPNGPNRLIVVEALNGVGNVSYLAQRYFDCNGEHITLNMLMAAESIPPVFAGLSGISMVTQTSMVLSWSPATDNVTPQNKIQYLIYKAMTSGGENFSVPSFITSLGATTFTVIGLTPGTTYCFVVRAMDEVGNIDTNTTELCAATTEALSISPSSVTIIALPNPDSSGSDNVTFTIQGGIPPYNVTSSNPSIIPSPGIISASSSSIVSSLQSASFTIDPDQDCSTTLVTLNVTDSGSGSVNATVNLNIPPFTDVLANNAICENTSACPAGTATTALTLTGVPPFDVTSSQPGVIPNPGTSWTNTYFIDAINNSITADTNVDLASSSYCDAGPRVSMVTVIDQPDIDLEPVNNGMDTSLIYCDVKNNGTTDAVNVEVWFDYTDGCVSSNCDDIIPITVLGMDFEFVSHAFAFLPYDYRIIVDPNNLIQETNESNNCISYNNPTMCFLPLPSTCEGM